MIRNRWKNLNHAYENSSRSHHTANFTWHYFQGVSVFIFRKKALETFRSTLRQKVLNPIKLKYNFNNSPIRILHDQHVLNFQHCSIVFVSSLKFNSIRFSCFPRLELLSYWVSIKKASAEMRWRHKLIVSNGWLICWTHDKARALLCVCGFSLL